MKFAKALDEDLVPEWRAKYLNYKEGKKRVKAVARAYAKVNSGASSFRTPGSANFKAGRTSKKPFGVLTPGKSKKTDTPGASGSTPGRANRANYGSISPGRDGEQTAPGTNRTVASVGTTGAASLHLPGPALSLSREATSAVEDGEHEDALDSIHNSRRSMSVSAGSDAYHIGPDVSPPKSSSGLLPTAKGRTFSMPFVQSPFRRGSEGLGGKKFFRRLVSGRGDLARYATSPHDMPLEVWKDVSVKKKEFYAFLDGELDKIETFYHETENRADKRLKVLRAQLEEMERRRKAKVQRETASKNVENGDSDRRNTSTSGFLPAALQKTNVTFRLPFQKELHQGLHGIRHGEPFQTINAGHAQDGVPHPRMPKMPNMPGRSNTAKSAKELRQEQIDNARDYTRRKPSQMTADGADVHHVPYATARRKLKLAMQEFYRGLDLLKSYAMLNRTAFRKILKKYDKAVPMDEANSSKDGGGYMAEKVHKSHFVQSEQLEKIIAEVENLYAEYFERGSHKIAVNKLKTKGRNPNAYNGNVFRNGFLLATGVTLGIDGLTYAVQRLSETDENSEMHMQTSYLLQLYGGYVLALALFLLFCLDCRVWMRNKINYVFIFEFETHHNLDWRQLAEIPCWFAFLLGSIVWLNFQQRWSDDAYAQVYIYWPVILVGITLLVLFFPARILYYRSRLWLLNANLRLFLPGLFHVEFQDFFLGDMYCSLSYSMQNVEVFFCLYAHHWGDPSQCNSSNSRLLGFFSTLPAILRAIQCVRRYIDSKNAFPHLYNCGKYTATIIYYMTLSIYRIDKSTTHLNIFIVFATINAIFVTFWDIAMDWSLGNMYSRNVLLRDTLGYKSKWPYFVAMVIDPIVRFNWIFYVIFAQEVQHSAVLSFMIGLSEVLRRGVWSVFRLENEHCTNVGRFRASRDVELPYKLDVEGVEDSDDESVKQIESQTSHEGLRETVVNDSVRKGKKSPTSPFTDAAAIEEGQGTQAQAQSQSQSSTLRPILKHTQTGATAKSQPKSIKSPHPFSTPKHTQTDNSRTPRSPFGSPNLGSSLRRMGSIIHAAHAQDFERKTVTRRDTTTKSDDPDSDEDVDESDAEGKNADDTLDESQGEVDVDRVIDSDDEDEVSEEGELRVEREERVEEGRRRSEDLE